MPAKSRDSRAEDTGERLGSPTGGERIAQLATRLVGSATAHWLAVVLVVVWVATGPMFAAHNEVYALLDQTVTGLSFLMLFLLQRSQNKDTLALQLKLDELIASNPRASNRVINAEEISEEELVRMRRHFQLLDRLAREAGEGPLTQENAYRRHEEEQRVPQSPTRKP